MKMPLITSGYQRVIIIDTQVVLETKPLEQLPWSEFGAGPILLLVCRQVQSEIDAKKNDGRLGKRARAFNKLLDAFIETRIPTCLYSGPPQIDVALVSNTRINWADLDDLDQGDGDDRIVGQALHALMDDRARLEILSHDMRPRDAAITHGLRATKLRESWLREPEPAPDERERARLERELSVLRSEQPIIEVAISSISSQPWQRTQVLPACEDQVIAIEQVLHRRAPRLPRPDINGVLFVDPFADPSLPERLTAWRKHLKESDLPTMHVGLERMFAQQRVRVLINNTGHISAEQLSLEIRSGNTTIHSIPYSVLVFGKPPPKSRDPLSHISSMKFNNTRPFQRLKPFVFYKEGEEPGYFITWSCSSFRQGKSYSVEVSIEIEKRTGEKAQIDAVVTASNMKGEARSQLIVPIVDITQNFSDIVDVNECRLLKRPDYVIDKKSEDSEFRIYLNDGSIYKIT